MCVKFQLSVSESSRLMALCFQPVWYAYRRGRGTFDLDSISKRQFRPKVSTLAATLLRYSLTLQVQSIETILSMIKVNLSMESEVTKWRSFATLKYRKVYIG